MHSFNNKYSSQIFSIKLNNNVEYTALESFNSERIKPHLRSKENHTTRQFTQATTEVCMGHTTQTLIK